MNRLMNFHPQLLNAASSTYSKVFMFMTLAIGSLIVGYFLRRFVFLFPLLVSVSWLIAVQRDTGTQGGGSLLPTRLRLALTCYLACLLVASLITSNRVMDIRELLLTLVGPLLIAFFVGRAMHREALERTFFLALLWGGVLLAVDDAFQYISDFALTKQFVNDFSHRWRTTAYILYLPFFLLFRDTLVGRRKVVFNIGLFFVFLLATCTGSRTAWGTLLLEIAALGMLTRQRQYLVDMGMFGFALAITLFALPHEIAMASLERGGSDNNRINGHWLPAIQMTTSSLGAFLMGQGYGTEVVVPPQFSGQATPLLAGPHNVFLQALLAGGVATLVSLVWLFAELGRQLGHWRDIQNETLKILALGGLVSFTGFFLIAGQVGDPRPEPLALFVLIAILLHRRKSAA